MLRTILCALLLCATLASAPLLRFQPVGSSTVPGGAVIVDIVLSGLPAGEPPSVGSFDLDITYNPSVVVPVGLEFGQFLGLESAGEVIQFAFDLGGVLDVGAVSLLTGPELDALQPGEFPLMRIAFLALAVGTSPLAFEQILIDDSDGVKLPVQGGGGGITVVPEPQTTALAGVGLLLIAARRLLQRPKM